MDLRLGQNASVQRKAVLFIIAFIMALIPMVCEIPEIGIAYAEETTAVSIDYPQPSGEPAVVKGDTGDAVCWLQTALNLVSNAGLTVDGDFGANTENAVKAFQETNGLPVTGAADTATIQALAQMTSPHEITQETASEEVIEETASAEMFVYSPFEIEGDRSAYFTTYWKNYFRGAVHYIQNFKFGTYLIIQNIFVFVRTLFVIGMVILAFWLISIVFPLFAYIMIRFENLLAYLATSLIQVVVACSFILISIAPIISDGKIMYNDFNMEFWGSAWRALLFQVIRLIPCLALYFLSVSLFAGFLSVVSYPFVLLAQSIRKAFNKAASYPSFTEVYHAIRDFEINEFSVTRKISKVLSYAQILFINLVPVYMSLVIYYNPDHPFTTLIDILDVMIHA